MGVRPLLSACHGPFLNPFKGDKWGIPAHARGDCFRCLMSDMIFKFVVKFINRFAVCFFPRGDRAVFASSNVG